MAFRRFWSLVLFAALAFTASCVDETGEGVESVTPGITYSASQAGLSSIGIGVKYSSTSTTFSIWSPDTSDVKIWVNGTTYTCSSMGVSGYSDIYGVTVSGDLHTKEYYYLIRGVKVRDPYGAMFNNATGNNVVIDNTKTDPDGGWAPRPALINREDSIVYEVHVRDFTIDSNSGVDATKRGKFLGMVQTGTKNSAGKATGIDHLKELGVTHVQILPFYDFGTGMYNWGYDPVNYNVPEEQYSISQDPVQRIKELKTMINEFHKNGIRVVMDVVYNHTFANDMFNPITPKYYDGLNLSGCGNSVDSGKPMVSRFIQDSLNYWASEYNIDGFRFDLVGIFYYTEADKWAQSVNANNPNANILWYGEPWNGYATDPNESQKVRMGKVPAMTAGHFGVFNGKFREAIKGDNDGTGKGYMFNVIPSWIDAIKVGIRGSILYTKSTNVLPNDWDSMFAYDPEQSINYISAHDNYCLWDKIVHSGATGSYGQRVDKFGTAILLTSQGIPFIHAGDEMLRTKVYNGDWTYAHNSYNAPDNYNMIRWNWKDTNSAVVQYYKDLIALRKAHPAFRLTTWDEINANVTTTTLTGGQVIINQINGAAVGDTWSKVISIYNSGSNYTYTLPSGQWYIAVEKENANAGGTPVSGTVVCEGTAVTVLYQTSTTPVVPSAPDNLTATAISSSQINLAWGASNGATSYTVSRATSSGGTYTTLGSVSGTSYANTGLAGSTTYYYKVTASNSAGTSAASNVASATTLPAGSGLKVHFKVNSYANWANVNCYYWASNGSPAANTWPGTAMSSEGNYWYVLTIPGATSSNVIFNNGSAQTVDLSRSGEGWFVPTGTSSGKITGTWYSSNPDNQTVPAAPQNLTAVTDSTSTIDLSWSSSTGATSYTVYKATSSGGTYSSVGTVTGTTYQATGLAAGTAYYFKVTASNTAGESAASNIASATTNSGGGTTTTTIKIVYDVGSGNTMYVRGSVAPLSWTTGAAMTWTTGNAWTYTTTAIPAGTKFEFKGLINNSRWSDGANFEGIGGQTMTVYPTFNGNFYDTMDTLNNWTVSSYTGTGSWHIADYRARAYACATESVMTTKFSMSKTGTTVTLSFKYQTTGLDSGEYLAVDVYNGSTWTQVGSYTGTAAATNKSINVTSYQSTNFKVRFRTKMNAADEYAYVDNVSVAVTN